MLRFCIALVPLSLASVASPVPAAIQRGQPLSEALSALGECGLRLVYSSRLVRESMHVVRDPESSSPRDVLDEVLAPHGLAVRNGPAGTLVVVREPIREMREVRSRATGREPPRPAAVTTAWIFEEHVDVSAKMDEGRQEEGALALDPGGVRGLPGGLGNVFRALDLAPGVQTTSELGSRFSVWGGDPDENLVILDGVEIYNPYRLWGATSIFPASAVASFELSRGGFGAAHGDRLSSVLDVTSRTGTTEHWLRGTLDVSTLDGAAVLEGRLPVLRASWLVSGHGTYYDWVADPALHADFPSFADLQVKLALEPWRGHRFSITRLVGSEDTAFRPVSLGRKPSSAEEEDFEIVHDGRTSLFALTYTTNLGDAGLSATLSRYRFANDFRFSGALYSTARVSESTGELLRPVLFSRGVAIEDSALRLSLKGVEFRGHSLDFGIELHGLETGWKYDLGSERSSSRANAAGLSFESLFLPGVALPARLDSELGSDRWGAWLEGEPIASERFTLEAGLRLDGSSLHRKTDVSPRLRAEFAASADLRLFGAAGLYYQTPGYEKLFLADQFLDLTRPEVRSRLLSERALVTTMGLEKGIGPLALSAEVHAKVLANRLVGRLESEEERRARVESYDFPPELRNEVPAAPLVTVEPVSNGSGKVLGAGLELSKSTGRLTGYLSYGYSRGRQSAYGLRFPLDYDRAHDAAGTLSYRLTPGISLALRGRIESGRPRTPAIDARVAAVRDGGRLVPELDETGALVYTQDYGDVSNLNSARNPTFARFDFRFSYHTGGGSGRWLWYLELINVFHQRNTLFVVPNIEFGEGGAAIREERLTSIPLLPSFGIRFEF